MKEVEILGLGLLVLVLLTSKRTYTPVPRQQSGSGVDPNVVIRTAGEVAHDLLTWASSPSEDAGSDHQNTDPTADDFMGPPAPTDGDTWYA